MRGDISSKHTRSRFRNAAVWKAQCKPKKQYIMDLRTVHELKNPQRNIKMDDVLLIEGDKFVETWTWRFQTRCFQVVAAKVRSCIRKAFDGTLKRPVQLLYPLER
ncbi:hypothetical protein CDAR_65911 [Caerostris darwini]|uniref:Uncharacterized protein n=1 Tax=Caerostris darwini TaxID=1538125 RepID=A0AAV4UCN9_9ARAC|nr:hypothetical protein CDAR_65911 [Caerostris darwini]